MAASSSQLCSLILVIGCHAEACHVDGEASWTQGKDLNLDIKRVVANRHWCNKLWNAIRFALLNLGSDFRPSSGFPADPARLPLACSWILSKLAATVSGTIDGFTAYEFGDTIQVRLTLYS